MNNLLREPGMEDINAAILATMTKLDELGVIDSVDPAHDVPDQGVQLLLVILTTAPQVIDLIQDLSVGITVYMLCVIVTAPAFQFVNEIICVKIFQIDIYFHSGSS